MPVSTTSPAGTPSPTDPAVRDAVTRWVAAGDGEPATTLAAVVAAVADARGLDVVLPLPGVVPDPAVLAVEVDRRLCAVAGPWLPGFVREALVHRTARRKGGVHHTAPEIALAIVDLVFSVQRPTDETVVADPAVGGGAFLLAAASRLPGTPGEVVARLRGVDTDPLAVAVTVAALEVWAHGAAPAADAVRVADFLAGSPVWHRAPDVITGNPPFLSQLRSDTVRDDARRRSLRERWPDVGGYVDESAAFLLAAVDEVAPAGVVGLVQPSSVLAARDATPVRARLREQAPLTGLWVDGEQRFDAAVDTVALVVRKGVDGGRLRRTVGTSRETAAVEVPSGPSWGRLLAGTTGVPAIDEEGLRWRDRLGDMARVTSGFRDEFYGLRDAVSEDPAGSPRLVTSGLIDPLRLEWGARVCRFDRRRWGHPVVDLDSVDPAIASWVADRLVPKLLVASQTRVLEVVVDSDGSLVPCTPVISVEPVETAPSLWHLAAVLSSPVAAALVASDAAGSALSRDAMRVSTRAVAALPLPARGAQWDAAAETAQRAQRDRDVDALHDTARRMLAAYGVAPRRDLFDWWQARLPDPLRADRG